MSRTLVACVGVVILLVPPPHFLHAQAPPAPLDFLQIVQRYADNMLDRGRDVFGPQKTGLFLSSLDRTTFSPLTIRPAAPAGIRREDRAGRPWTAMNGANPQLDENLLRVLYTLTLITGDNRYERAADAEITWFFNNAISPATGLLPWGEHMSWDVVIDEPIAGGTLFVHEFARPWVLWDRSFAIAPDASKRFALGLWEHQIANHKTGGFDRHAPYAKHGPADGKDFPRHGGFYVATWASAWKHTKDQVFLDAIAVILDRFERKRIQKDGSLAMTIGPLDCETAASLLEDPLAKRLRDFAEKEDQILFADWQKQSPLALLPMWQMAYGGQTAAAWAMFCLARYEQVQKPQYRDAIISVADAYLHSLPEEDADIWPMTFAHAISTEVAAYRLTQREAYRLRAIELANMAAAIYWQDNPLPRASFKVGHYETITGCDSLALALLEVHALTRGLKIAIPSNTIDR